MKGRAYGSARVKRLGAPVLLCLVLSLLVSACGSSSKPPTAAGTATAPITPTPIATSSPSPLKGVSEMPLQTPHGGEFVSPSGNISCEIDYQRARVPDGAYCETLSPPRSILISTTGAVLRSCDGEMCLSNAGMNTPTLPYSSATGVGPLWCVSMTGGMMCAGSGTGFEISRAGIATCAGSSTPGTLTVCPESGPVGSTVTIAGRGCSAGFVTFLGPGSNGPASASVEIPVAPEASNDFAGTWTIPSTYHSGGNNNTPLPVKPGSDYQLQTPATGCHAPFHIAKSHP